MNRSQHDININKGMAAARDAERIFFESHPAYNGVVQQCGVAVLAKVLSPCQVVPRDQTPGLVGEKDRVQCQIREEEANTGKQSKTGRCATMSIRLEESL